MLPVRCCVSASSVATLGSRFSVEYWQPGDAGEAFSGDDVVCAGDVVCMDVVACANAALRAFANGANPYDMAKSAIKVCAVRRMVDAAAKSRMSRKRDPSVARPSKRKQRAISPATEAAAAATVPPTVFVTAS